jgi:hypothetical protein
MARTARGGRKRFRRRDRDDAGAPEGAAERDLTDYVGGYLIPEDQQTATTSWRPSRRGNSPHHRD